MNKIQQRLAIVIVPFCFGLTACQTVPLQPVNVSTTPLEPQKPQRLESFDIYGKFGFVNQDRTQSGSAFYQWKQQQDRFAMQLEGALGLGATRIEYNGSQAQLTNAVVGTIKASTPEELLNKATPFDAPISQMPYWISGLPTPTDIAQTWDSKNRLATSVNGDWTASFFYANSSKLPKKIVTRHRNNTKVVLTINHN